MGAEIDRKISKTVRKRVFVGPLFYRLKVFAENSWKKVEQSINEIHEYYIIIQQLNLPWEVPQSRKRLPHQSAIIEYTE